MPLKTKTKSDKIKDNKIKAIKTRQTMFIGDKDVMAYVLTAYDYILNNHEVEICARGRHISKAVDIVQLLATRLGIDNKYKIQTGTEEFERNGVLINISTISIVI